MLGKKPKAAVALIAIACVWTLMLSCGAFSGVSAEQELETYDAAIGYCRTKPDQLVLSDDHSIFCFDGALREETDTSSLKDLREGGLFVVRSRGGDGLEAIKLSMLLGEKRAIVVIYDYCISACAQFFFVASGRTHVSRDAIVAWHHGWNGGPVCDEIRARTKRLTRRLCSISNDPREQYFELRALGDRFFKERVIELGNFSLDFPPQSVHMAKVLRALFESTGTYPSVVWLWNPRYYKTTLKTEITYESYPESQEQVDELVVRLFGERAQKLFGPNGGRILYDP